MAHPRRGEGSGGGRLRLAWAPRLVQDIGGVDGRRLAVHGHHVGLREHGGLRGVLHLAGENDHREETDDCGQEAREA